MIQLREQFDIHLSDEESAALETMGMKEGDVLKTCEAMKALGVSSAQIKNELLRDAYQLQLLPRPDEEVTKPDVPAVLDADEPTPETR